MLFNKTEYPKVHNTTYLYYLGDECVDITGGWHYTGWGGSAEFNENHIKVISNNTGSGDEAGVSQYNQFDNTDYRLLTVYTRDLTNISGPGYYIICAEEFNVGGNLKVYNAGLINYEYPQSQRGVRYHSISTSWGGCTISMYMMCLSKQDNLQGLSAYGTDIATIISNAIAMIQDHNAVIYMLNQCTGDFMWSALADSTFVSTLRTSPYYSEIMADEDWHKALALFDV